MSKIENSPTQFEPSVKNPEKSKSPVQKLTLEQQIQLCSGEGFWNTKKMPGIPSIMVSDGPHGLRKQEDTADMLGLNNSIPATSFPTAVSTACSWDPALIAEVGHAIAEEALANEVGVVLGPGANIKRSPLCGRNFEYFSEDPYLTGKLAAAYIQGAQSTGAGTSLKHFAMNNQEYKRFSSDSLADERTMREIYLAGFETAVKEGQPATVMCAYNKINGVHCSDSKMLLTDILRKEWGFNGMVVTDWGAMCDRIEAFKAGCDLCMPGGSAYMEKEALKAVEDGTLSAKHVERSATRVAKLAIQKNKVVQNAVPADMEAHNTLACRAAAESAVLLKNADTLLPLREDAKVVFLGHMAKELRYQGAGSSHINPYHLTQVTDVCPTVPFAAGCTPDGSTSEELLEEARKLAQDAEVAVVFAGLTDTYESEGFDRENMAMPEGHNQLIQAVAAVNPNTVVVLLAGSAIELPWAEDVKAILYMGLPGQAGGQAIADLLYGKSVPCGKLAESWPVKYEDCICSSYYLKGGRDAQYREGVYVGYRYYTSAGVPVRYPFGYGLSYTSFAYSDLTVNGQTVTCKIRNTGNVAGKEIAQLYIAPPQGPFYRPARELKAFAKVSLEPGEETIVTFTLNDRSFALWNHGWFIPEGTYTILVGSSSEELPLSQTIEKEAKMLSEDSASAVNSPCPKAEESLLEAPEVSIPSVPAWYFAPQGVPSQEDFEQLLGRKVSEKPLKKGEFTMENTVMEMKDYSLAMKMMFKGVELYMAKGFGGKVDYSNPSFRMMISSALDCSMSGMKINGAMNNAVMEGMLEMANGHYLKGIKKMITG